MTIDRVTITGADNSIRPADLLPLTRDFPFVEWGILASEGNTYALGQDGTARYPTPQWITDLQDIAETTGELPKLALHIDGRWVRDLLKGQISIPKSLLRGFARVQLNFHAARNECEPGQFAQCLRELGRSFIFQFDGEMGNAHFTSIVGRDVPPCHGLFDTSGGAGVLPGAWPAPIWSRVNPRDADPTPQFEYHGYAGGLGPHNLAEQIPRILDAAVGTESTREGRIWIDMETHVRSQGDTQFDLAKVRRCLEIAAPYVHAD